MRIAVFVGFQRPRDVPLETVTGMKVRAAVRVAMSVARGAGVREPIGGAMRVRGGADGLTVRRALVCVRVLLESQVEGHEQRLQQDAHADDCAEDSAGRRAGRAGVPPH